MEDALRTTFIPVIASLLIFNASCGMLQRTDEVGGSRQSRKVPREQYDQLLLKYEELAKKYESLKETGVQSTLADEIQAGSTSETETVDLFAKGPQSSAPASNIQVPADIEAQLNLYRRGIELKASNSGEATKIFQQLENQGIPPVKARAKLQIGQILFEKQQFDLALQVFEDIIQRNASSGVVIDALRFAVAASDKLGIQNKKDQYSSMLNDVFGSN
jgi:tetratricopeptide (TPR) repeat protein